ncbi:FAD-dependent oxidoreductase [Alteromonas sediminis]|uniref:FAD-dependent oxidoreductase n=1 Tax=Alteromonas sediminis TaxID=2259342 RepID=A0A3N5XXM7_9ALTE|nr:FAD-dependent oxidoreductase [Alteromonas sediminis]RPJ65572.1 FAD-dependent oxidoreductase [Alteromonas sediminis]
MTAQRKKVAIVGTGISGLTCAYFLNKRHDITVFEANDYIGGHTATKDVTVEGQSYAIDTGFIVFNDWTYPNFIKLMDELHVARQPTEMSFSVRNKLQNLEYNGHDLNSLFAQRRNIFRPRFWRIVSDILRFNKRCKSLVESKTNTDNITLFEFIEQEKLSDDFAKNYILPMCAAIWSASVEDVKAFPLTFFLQFFNNHGLLNVADRPQWYTLVGGSRSYIDPLTSTYKDKILLNTPVSSVTKTLSGDKTEYTLVAKEQQFTFDEVIFACHSDQALRCLALPSEEQRAILGAIPYAMNEVVLHTDVSVLPKRKLAWASWNYDIKGDDSDLANAAAVSYNMNILQRLNVTPTFCVTLNNTSAIKPSSILGKFKYAHPQYNMAMVAAQQQRAKICGIDGLHFCGAYWYNGFHEDGVRSALDVVKRFGVEW